MFDFSINTHPIFKHIGRVELARLMPFIDRLELNDGEKLFSIGDICEYFYLVEKGAISVKQSENEVVVRRVGDCVGLRALVSDTKTNADAFSVGNTIVIKIPKQKFNYIVEKHPPISIYMNTFLATNGEFNQSVIAEEKEDKIKTGSFLWKIAPAQNPVLFGIIISILMVMAITVLRKTVFNYQQVAIMLSIIGASVFWAFNVFSYHAVAVSIPLVLVIVGATTPDKVLIGFSTPSWFLVFCVFALSAAATHTGLVYRTVLYATRWFPKSYIGQAFAFAVAGVVLTPVIPSSNGRAALAGPLVQTICETLKLRKGSPAAIGIAMSALLGFGHMSSLFMNGTATCLLAFSLLPQETINKTTWGSWFLDSLPFTGIYFLVSFLFIINAYRPQKHNEIKETMVKPQLDSLGKITKQEGILLFVILLTILGFITQSLHHIQPAFIAGAGFIILFASNILTEKNIKTDIDWNFMLSFGALISLGSIISASGLPKLFSEELSPFLSHFKNSPTTFLVVVSLLVIIARFALPLPAGLLVGILPTVPIAVSIGINPIVIAFVVLIASNPWFMIHQNSVYQNFMEATSGKVFEHKTVWKMSFWQCVAIFIAIMASVPYWTFRGLM